MMDLILKKIFFFENTENNNDLVLLLYKNNNHFDVLMFNDIDINNYKNKQKNK